MTPVNEDTVSVTAGHTASGNIFRTHLNELFATAGPDLSNAAVVRGLVEHGCRISKPYLFQLRRGLRSSPSDEVVAALADYFGVTPGYFFAVPLTAAVGRDVHVEDADIVERLDDPTQKAYCWRRTDSPRRHWNRWPIWPLNFASPTTFDRFL